MQREYHFDHKNQLQFSRIHQSPKCQESFSTTKKLQKKRKDSLLTQISLSKSKVSDALFFVTYTGLIQDL